jgi:hypothetical protein
VRRLATPRQDSVDTNHCQRMLTSRFNIHRNARQLAAVYEELLRTQNR